MICFLANLSSRPVDNWANLYEVCGIKISTLFSIHKCCDKTKICDDVFVFDFFKNKLANYIALGLFLRLKRRKPKLLHVHGASGYGLTALISGIKYVATVYGSEVLSDKHSYIYKRLVNRILTKSVAITVASDEAKDIIERQMGIEKEKILCFHTGIDIELIKNRFSNYTFGTGKDNKIKLLSVRNSAPQYRTMEILEAFRILLKTNRNVTLTIIKGNGDEAYYNKLVRHANDNSMDKNVVFVGSLLTKEQLIDLILSSDACISFPVTDQLSSTILECLYVSSLVVSAELPAYECLNEIDIYKKIKYVKDEDDLLQTLTKICTGNETYLGKQKSLNGKVEEKYSYNNGVLSLHKLVQKLE